MLRTIQRSGNCSMICLVSNFELSRVLIGGLRFLGKTPCPRCSIPKELIQNLGTKEDKEIRETHCRSQVSRSSRRLVIKARDLIYNEGYAVNSKAAEALLQSTSLVPTDVRDTILSCQLLSALSRTLLLLF